jgi:UDP-N-acetyl-2-amino-2-deoxyglucuronate dehydrogenase
LNNSGGFALKNVKIGLIGCGLIGEVHAKVINELRNAELIAAADTDELKTKKMSNLYGCTQFKSYRDMLLHSNIDMVSVCVPPSMHYRIVMDAATAGKHVIVEKPMDVSTDRADRMISECRKQRVKFSVIFQHRFDRVIRILKESVAEGRFGKLLMGTSNTIWYRDFDYYQKNPWRGTYANGGGALMNQAIHYIDLLQYIMGDIESVSAVCDTLSHKSIHVEDTGIAILKFKNGAIGTINGTTIAYPGLYSELNIYGEDGSVSIKNDRLDFYAVKSGSIPEMDKLKRFDSGESAAVSKAENLDTEAHKKQYEDFLMSITEDREPLINGEEGRKAIALINAIYQSSKEKKWVNL